MKTNQEGYEIEGTPEEIVELLQLLKTKKDEETPMIGILKFDEEPIKERKRKRSKTPRKNMKLKMKEAHELILKGSNKSDAFLKVFGYNAGNIYNLYNEMFPKKRNYKISKNTRETRAEVAKIAKNLRDNQKLTLSESMKEAYKLIKLRKLVNKDG